MKRAQIRPALLLPAVLDRRQQQADPGTNFGGGEDQWRRCTTCISGHWKIPVLHSIGDPTYAMWHECIMTFCY